MNGPHVSELPEPRGVCSCARGINPARGGDSWGGRWRFTGWGSHPRVRGGPLAATRQREGQILGLGHGWARWAERQPGLCPGAPGPGLLSWQFTHLLSGHSEPLPLEPPGSSGSHGDEEAAPGGARPGPGGGSSSGGGGQARPHHTGCLSRSSAPQEAGIGEQVAWGPAPLLFLMTLGPRTCPGGLGTLHTGVSSWKPRWKE